MRFVCPFLSMAIALAAPADEWRCQGEQVNNPLGLDFSAISAEYPQIHGKESCEALPWRLLVRPKPQITNGVVSVKELQHHPSRAALKAYNQSVDKKNKGDLAGSLALLEKAVKLDPEYLPALNNLGARYTLLQRFPEAIECFERAISISPENAVIRANLSQTFIYAEDFPAAEMAARQATKLDPALDRASYLLGVSLLLQNKITSETVKGLKKGAHVSPRAQLALGVALARSGALSDARATLQQSARSSDLVVRQEAEQLLARLP